MGKTSRLEIKESLEYLEKAFNSSKSFKVRQRIQGLLLSKQKKFNRQKDLSEHLGVDHSTLKRWLKQYREEGFESLVTLRSGGNYKGVVGEELHRALQEKVNDANDPLLGYWHAVQWVEQEHGHRINYQTLRAYLIRHFKTKKKHPRKSHYKKDEQALEVFKKTP